MLMFLQCSSYPKSCWFAWTDFSPFLLFINYQTINKSSDGQQRYLHPITHGTNHKQEAASLMEKPGSGLLEQPELLMGLTPNRFDPSEDKCAPHKTFFAYFSLSPPTQRTLNLSQHTLA